VLNYSDGKHSLQDISRISGITFKQIKQAAKLLQEKELLKQCFTERNWFGRDETYGTGKFKK
jgi:hypothetical protein